jgi:hypothetical protein
MNETLHLYLTAGTVLLRREHGLPWARRIAPTGQASWNGAVLDPAALAAGGLELAASGRRWRPCPLHVYLGSALCRFMVATLPQGLRDDAERQAAAAAQMRHHLGLDGAEWSFALDAAAQPSSTVVCAVRQDLIGQLRRLAAAHRLVLASVRPFATGIWNASQSSGAEALIVVEDDAFTLFAPGTTGLEAVNTLAHRREHELIDRELRRVALARGAGGSGAVRLALPAHLDAMAPASARRALGRSGHLDREHHADFRDLVFRPALEDAA